MRTFKSPAMFCGCTNWLVSDLVGNLEDMFSHDKAPLGLILRKAVFIVADQVRLRLVCSATEKNKESWNFLDIKTGDISHIDLFRQQTTMVLIRLHRCTG